MPGGTGFERDHTIVVNLSYWVYPALLEFAAQRPQDQWQTLVNDGLSILDRARFGRWGLPADWIEVGSGIQIAQGFPPRFSYDAIRIPLYLYWARLGSSIRWEPYLRFWDYFAQGTFTPAWTNLQDDSVDSHNASPGFHAIISLARRASEGNPHARYNRNNGSHSSNSYYSDVLHLLANVAEHESYLAKGER